MWSFDKKESVTFEDASTNALSYAPVATQKPMYIGQKSKKSLVHYVLQSVKRKEKRMSVTYSQPL
jgi:hypothetical protein